MQLKGQALALEGDRLPQDHALCAATAVHQALLLQPKSPTCCQGRPFRGHARSHRITTVFRICTVLVGAGVPGKRPAQALPNFGIKQICPLPCRPFPKHTPAAHFPLPLLWQRSSLGMSLLINDTALTGCDGK